MQNGKRKFLSIRLQHTVTASQVPPPSLGGGYKQTDEIIPQEQVDTDDPADSQEDLYSERSQPTEESEGSFSYASADEDISSGRRLRDE